jgi:hypothetical protein
MKTKLRASLWTRLTKRLRARLATWREKLPCNTKSEVSCVDASYGILSATVVGGEQIKKNSLRSTFERRRKIQRWFLSRFKH